MGRMSLLRVAAALAITIAVVRPVSGQVVSYVDERGKRVFINVEPAKQQKPTKRYSLTARPRNARQFDRSVKIPSDIHEFIEKTAARNAIDPKLVDAIIQVESNWNPIAISRKGAMGLMQLIPATAARFGVMDIFDPKQNIEGGIRYLRFLLDTFRGDLHLSLAAYNAGENTVLQIGGIPAYRETREYVDKVTTAYSYPSDFWRATVRGAPASGGRIYRYVDESGRVTFSNF